MSQVTRHEGPVDSGPDRNYTAVQVQSVERFSGELLSATHTRSWEGATQPGLSATGCTGVLRRVPLPQCRPNALPGCTLYILPRSFLLRKQRSRMPPPPKGRGLLRRFCQLLPDKSGSL
jgi:hypothetical protein